MKYKKVVAVLLAVGCIGLVGTLGYFLGQTNQKEQIGRASCRERV